MKLARVTIVTAMLIAAAAVANAETVRIAGSGGMIPMITSIGKAYMKKNPADNIEVNQKSLGKEGGVMALTRGNIDIAMLSSLEAKDKGLPINAVETAIVPSLFAVHPSVKVKALSGQQICDIYSGKITDWKQVGGASARIVVLTRPENESAKIAIRQGLGCFASLTETPTAITLAKSQEMRDTLIKTANAIGMINTIALDDAAGKVVAIKQDGKDVATTPVSQWPMKTLSYLATGKNPGGATKRFMQFVKSPEGQKIIKKEKAYPVP
jgi:phosphate transport system substrate-binding protein